LAWGWASAAAPRSRRGEFPDGQAHLSHGSKTPAVHPLSNFGTSFEHTSLLTSKIT